MTTSPAITSATLFEWGARPPMWLSPKLCARIATIVHTCCERFHVAPESLFQEDRGTSKITDARLFIMAVLRRGGMPLAWIGETFNRTHCCVVNAVEKVPARLAADPDLLAFYSSLFKTPTTHE